MAQHQGFKLIMAVSADGYLARGPKDNMRWTGFTDKQVFRLLTASHPVLLIGRQTHDVMPPLPWRQVVCLSRDPAQGLSLEQALEQYPGAWLGGGAQVAQAALEKDMVDTTFLCHTSAMLGGGIPSGPIRALLPKVAKYTVVMDLTSTIEVFHHRLGS
jgi:dihydrofolate reductase